MAASCVLELGAGYGVRLPGFNSLFRRRYHNEKTGVRDALLRESDARFSIGSSLRDGLFHLLDAHIAELDFHRRSGVHLQGDAAALGHHVGPVIRQLARFHIVD